VKTKRVKGSPGSRSTTQEIISFNPSTGEELGRVAGVGRRGIKEAITRATEAFEGWSCLSIRQRQQYLARLCEVILAEKEDIVELIAREQGKPVTEAMGSEVLPVLGVLTDLSRNAHRALQNQSTRHQQVFFAHKRSQHRYVPYGVIAIISPWNYPFSVPIPQIAAALVTGNTVVFKPALSTALIGRKIDELFRTAGFPEDVLNTVMVKGQDAAVMARHPAVKKIVFTGSTEVGRQIMSAAAEGIKPVVLELGGKDPAVVAADADIARAAKGIVWGAMFGAGQVCASIERVYVERPVADRFISACVWEAAKLRVGDPLNKDTDIGPLTTRRQLTRVKAHVQDAVQRGAKVLIGGKRKGKMGFFYEPTILSHVNHAMAVMVEETFGPVLPIMVVDSIDEAIRLANDSVYGLSAYGWTRSRRTAERLMNELEAGTVMINDAACTWGEPNAPWGGMKSSGIGRTRAVFGLREMVQLKYTSFDPGEGRENAWWFPYNQETRNLFTSAGDLMFTKSVWKKLAPMLALLRNRRFLKTARWGSILGNLNKLL
jgi:acyl-CoA reductase-like NAD-dependent aldehyde dehydrogenase